MSRMLRWLETAAYQRALAQRGEAIAAARAELERRHALRAEGVKSVAPGTHTGGDSWGAAAKDEDGPDVA